MLTVEDGLGLSTAQSYTSVEDATTYHASMGNVEWANRPDLQESCLVRATQMLDLVWGQKYLSRKRTRTQALLFPRLGFYNNNGDYVYENEIPTSLKNATAELALQFINNDGAELLVNDTQTNIKRTTQKVGDLEETIEYTGSLAKTMQATQKQYSKVDLLLAPLTCGPNYSIRL